MKIPGAGECPRGHITNCIRKTNITAFPVAQYLIPTERKHFRVYLVFVSCKITIFTKFVFNSKNVLGPIAVLEGRPTISVTCFSRSIYLN